MASEECAREFKCCWGSQQSSCNCFKPCPSVFNTCTAGRSTSLLVSILQISSIERLRLFHLQISMACLARAAEALNMCAYLIKMIKRQGTASSNYTNFRAGPLYAEGRPRAFTPLPVTSISADRFLPAPNILCCAKDFAASARMSTTSRPCMHCLQMHQRSCPLSLRLVSHGVAARDTIRSRMIKTLLATCTVRYLHDQVPCTLFLI